MKSPLFMTMTSWAAVSAVLFAAQQSQGALLVTFDDTGTGITATVTGSLDLVGLTRVADDIDSPESAQTGTSTALVGLTVSDPNSDVYSGGDVTASGLSAAPQSGPTVSFGYQDGLVFVDWPTALNRVLTMGAGETFGWGQELLSDIGLGSLSTTPTTVWNNPNASGTSGSIQFVNAVPEPGLPFFLGLACLGVFVRRKR